MLASTPRRALETTAFGYEVIASSRCMDDCVATVHWIDCWCPDAAQFILVEVSSDLCAKNCQDLVRSIDDSHLRHKIRLVCRAESLSPMSSYLPFFIATRSDFSL